jgi:hypothetical protein
MVNPVTNGTYLGAIACGRFISEPAAPERNLGVGEYGCMAFQEQTTHSNQSHASYLIPCQYIQLAECGCAPHDVHLWGLDPPSHACRTKDDCPFLCADAGAAKVKELCHAFGGVDWWSTRNVFGQDLFVNNHHKITLDIFEADA